MSTAQTAASPAPRPPGRTPDPRDVHPDGPHSATSRVVPKWREGGVNLEDIAKGLRAEDDVDEIAKLCADLAAVGSSRP